MIEQLKAIREALIKAHQESSEIVPIHHISEAIATLTQLEAMVGAQEPQAEAVPADQSKWCAYIAGVIGCYLGEADDSAKVKAIAGIIERRLWALAPQQAKAVPPINDL